MSRTYPELDVLHAAFLRALHADPEPATSVADFSYEVLEANRDPASPSARSRGSAFLAYLDGHREVADVPGQEFAPDALPSRVCEALLSRHAASMDGPWALTFRYERGADGRWVGGYTIETSSEHEALVRGRREIDARMADVLRAQWSSGVTRLKLLYGAPSWKDPGPKMVVMRGTSSEIIAPEPAVLSVWQEFVEYLRSHGFHHLYYADFSLLKPNAKLKEGENVQLRYSR